MLFIISFGLTCWHIPAWTHFFPFTASAYGRAHISTRIWQRALPADYDPRPYDSNDLDELALQHYQGYCAEVGLESSIGTYGDFRPLTFCEYEAAFTLFPGLRNASLSKIWPSGRVLTSLETEHLTKLFQEAVVPTQEDAKRELQMFRKVVLGLEKYRIGNPGIVAEKYSRLLQVCLSAEDSWGYAANAVEYAGLYFKNYIKKVPKHKGRVALNSTALFTDSLEHLLGLNPLNSSSGAWDQRHFAQSAVDDEAQQRVTDMLLYLTQLAVRACFSRNSLQEVLVEPLQHVPEWVRRFAPSAFSLDLALQGRFGRQHVEKADALEVAGPRGIADIAFQEEEDGQGVLVRRPSSFAVTAA
jgi:hypothetical protein